MSRRDPAVSLRQMRDHAHEVMALVRGRSRRDLDSDRLLALARQAARNHWRSGRPCATQEQARRPSVPWSSTVGLRNRLIHGYDDFDHDIVWQIVTVDLPALVVELSRSIPEAERNDDDGPN
jgi:uncharacterized protein with HEPN domain